MTAESSGLPRGSKRATFGDNAIVARAMDRMALLVLLAALAVVVGLPMLYVFGAPLEDGARGIRGLSEDPQFFPALGTTAGLTLGSAALALVAGVTLAWLGQQLPARLRWLGLVPFLPLIMPQIALVLGDYFLLNPSVGFANNAIRALTMSQASKGPIDVFSVQWMVVISAMPQTSFVYLFVRNALFRLGQELTEAALVSGASGRRVFVEIVLPLLRPALAYSVPTILLLGLGQFSVPLILGSQTGISVLTTEMYYRVSSFPPNYAVAGAYALPILLAGLAGLASQRLLLRHQERFVTAGSRGTRPMVGRSRFLAPLSLATFGLVSFVLPVLAVTVVALQPYWHPDVRITELSFDNIRSVLSAPDLATAIRNSVVFAGLTVAAAVPLGYVCASVIFRRRHLPLIANLLDILVNLPLGIPTVILGVGFLLTFTQSIIRLYGSPVSMVLTYVVLMLPFATRMTLVGMTAVGSEFGDAAAVHGADRLRRAAWVDLPLLRPVLASTAALVVVLTTHEFSASLLIRSHSTQVMGTVLYDLFNFGSYPLSAVMALIMGVVTTVGLLVALRFSGPRLSQASDSISA